MTDYEQLLQRFQRRWGDEFDSSHLCQKFVPYYNSDQRIKVKFWDDEDGGSDGIKFGTVGVTTGWRPSFMLMLRSNDAGSIWLLDDGCKILAVKVGSKYIELTEVI